MTDAVAPAPPSTHAPHMSARADFKTRLVAGACAMGALSVLTIAAMLTPSARGHGTHEQLGMMPCTWAAVLDRPCPTCGMTTSFSHAANGSLMASFATQPFGAFLALLTASVFWGALHIAVTGSRVGRLYAPLLRPRQLAILGVLLAAAWGYKLLTWTGAGG